MKRWETPHLEVTRSTRKGSFAWGHGLIFVLSLAFYCTTLAAASPRYQEGELLVRFRDRNPQVATALQHQFKHGVKRRLDHVGWHHVTLPKGLSVADALKRYARHQDVLEVEPNYILNGVGMICDANPVPNDPSFPAQWALQRIGATAAWDITTGSEDVVIAVIDSGREL